MNLSDNWGPSRWWRVTFQRDGEQEIIWCETSSEEEARASLASIPADATEPRLERLWERHQTEWRSTQ